MDAVDEADLAERFGVTGFPTLKYFPAGDGVEAEAYNGGRDLESFVEFLNEKVRLCCRAYVLCVSVYVCVCRSCVSCVSCVNMHDVMIKSKSLPLLFSHLIYFIH